MKDIRLADIKLLPPAPSILKKAKRLLIEKTPQARLATMVTQIILVGQHKTDEDLDHQCHANLLDMISYGHSPKKLWPYYRYLVQFTNHQLKPQYHDQAHTKPFVGRDLDELRAYYTWLAHDSHFARFIVGDKRPWSLTNFGCIIDLSAPSFVVHMLAVLWRIPGEYDGMAHQWHTLVKRGVDPHLALAIIQNIDGWDYAKETLFTHRCRGHRVMGTPSIEVLARMMYGVCKANKGHLVQARCHYSTSSNQHFGDSNMYNNNNSAAWNTAYAKAFPDRCKETVGKTVWGADCRAQMPYAKAFDRASSPGFLWVLGQIGAYAESKGW